MNQYRQKITRLLAQHQLACEQVKQEKKSIKAAKEIVENTEQAQKIFQLVAESVQQQAHKQIASVVTQCLKTVFGEEAYELKIIFRQKRGRTEAELAFVRGEMELDPSTSTGGGVIDVAAFALRLACIVLARPKRRRLLVLDEPFRFVNGEEYQEKIGKLLSSLVKDLDVQIIMVTDDSWLKIGEVIEL